MFELDQKPAFHNYPLSKAKESYLNDRIDQLNRQVASMRVQLGELERQSDHQKYRPYCQRLLAKIAVLSRQIRQNQKILQVHATIERQARRENYRRAEVKEKMLDHYKAVIMAKRAEKIRKEWKEKQRERKLLLGEEIAVDQQRMESYLQNSRLKIKELSNKQNPQHTERRDLYNKDSFLPILFSERGRSCDIKDGTTYYNQIRATKTKNKTKIQQKRKAKSWMLPYD